MAHPRASILRKPIPFFISCTVWAITSAHYSTVADLRCLTIFIVSIKSENFSLRRQRADARFISNSAGGKVLYSNFFLQEFLPFIESHYRIRKGREHRAISGISMGGYGALRFAFAYPQLFSAVSAQSAALMTESPQELDLAMQSGYPLTNLIATVFGDPINEQHWHNNNPFVLAEKNRAALRRMAIYFNCGKNDNYGFEKGAAALNAQLNREDVKHEYHLYPGDHSYGYFMAHFPEVMEFHSRAFGLK